MGKLKPNEVQVQSHIDAAVEVYNSCIIKAKTMLETTFDKPSNYYDGEKKNVLNIACEIFKIVASKELIDQLSKGNVSPNIESAYASAVDVSEDGAKDPDGATTPNIDIKGF